MTTEAPVYAVPALEKALDVLEFLAGAPTPVSQNDIAKSTGRTVAEIFRILSVLEKRGYIAREASSGQYSLTLRMLRVATRHEPLHTLVTLAREPLRRLADSIEQSCNLGVREGDSVVVVEEAAGPAPFGFRVKAGATFPLDQGPTGAVLLAFAESATPTRFPDAAPSSWPQLAAIRALGHAEAADHLHAGVTDIAVPLLDRTGVAIAALTVPYVATSYSRHPLDVVRREALHTAAAVSALLDGAA